MIPEALSSPPSWLVLGVGLGLAGSAGVALAFVLAARFSAAENPHRRDYSGETRRRSEFRDYLGAIEEPFAENHFVGGQHVAFYLPKRDVAITFDPRAYYRIDRTDTEPVLVEHEVPGPLLGERLPFEVPEVERRSFDRTDPTRAAFAELGLTAEAGLGEVKRAYRRRVKEVHPDQGGDEDAFRRVREAYTTAKKHAS